MSDYVIRAKDLNYSYTGKDSLEVLKGVNINFERGLFYSIIGPNGSGKTTLLKCLNGMLKCKKDTIFLNNLDITSLSPNKIARNVSFVPQNTIVDFEFSAFDIVLMGRSPYLKSFQSESKEDLLIAEISMVSTNTWHLRDKNINEISGGERQRVIVARALAQHCPIMLLDEPVSMLDIHHQVELLNTVRTIVKNTRTTAISVMHDLNMAARYSDRIILLQDGKIVSEGMPNDVLTEENISQVYNLRVKLISSSFSSSRIIVPI